MGVVRFGVDGSGNYGYKKEGADTVYPFKSQTDIDASYNSGYSSGRTQGQSDITSNPNGYNLYTKSQYDSNYNSGYNKGKTDALANVPTVQTGTFVHTFTKNPSVSYCTITFPTPFAKVPTVVLDKYISGSSNTLTMSVVNVTKSTFQVKGVTAGTSWDQSSGTIKWTATAEN